MDSLNLDPDSVDNLDMYNSIPSVLMEKCAALSVRPDTVKSLIQSMQGWCCSHGVLASRCRLSIHFYFFLFSNIMLFCIFIYLSTIWGVHGCGGIPEGNSGGVRRR